MPRLLRTLLALALTLVAAVLVVALRARGWPVVPDLVPPGGDPLGLTPILYALAGSLAGRGSRVGPVPVRWVAIVTLGAALVPAAGRLLQGAWLGRQLDVLPAALAVSATVLVAAFVVPPLIRLDRGREAAW